MPREILLKKVPFPMPTPSLFNLDVIEALTSDTLVSNDGASYELMVFLIVLDQKCIFTIHLSLPNGFAALTFDDPGIAQHKLKGYPVEYLIQYRKGGPQYGSTVSEKLTPEPWP